MATYEMLGSKWPVVSIKRGASSAVKDIKESIEYIESFENVILALIKTKPVLKMLRRLKYNPTTKV